MRISVSRTHLNSTTKFFTPFHTITDSPQLLATPNASPTAARMARPTVSPAAPQLPTRQYQRRPPSIQSGPDLQGGRRAGPRTEHQRPRCECGGRREEAECSATPFETTTRATSLDSIFCDAHKPGPRPRLQGGCVRLLGRGNNIPPSSSSPSLLPPSFSIMSLLPFKRGTLEIKWLLICV